MTALDIVVICLMAICLVVGVGEPLARRRLYSVRCDEGDNDTERLLLQKEMLYGAIRDLDFDFQTGKVDQQDYAELRQQLEGEAVQILRQLDAADSLVALDHEIEQQVLALRRHSASTVCGSHRDSCSGCGTPLDDGENFCPYCGQAARRS
jgi:zinc ribbon protein